MGFLSFLALFYFLSILLFPFNLFINIEKVFSQPIYNIRKLTDPHTVKPANTYTIALVGDSMTEYLGNGEGLKNDLKVYYPDKTFNILNYGYGSTNVLSIMNRLQDMTNHNGTLTPSILSQNFDLFLLESFGNNPLSTYSTQEGLLKQTQALDQIIKAVSEHKPQSEIVLMTTVAPNRDRYGEGAVNLTTTERQKWADERIAYMKNHIMYANSHHIPLINLYEKSLDKAADYINSTDFIHPSSTGIGFINQQIADYIFQNRLLPL
ncbi:MAG: SGNH/GDSL hydrolase family protein [Candidatus Daviesbacteria bacterium]|nr:SGNH/GDSL hydrolase family protein [Candidatus Daviesbacteria bacterium]